MGYYDMANDYPSPQGHRDHIIGDNARIVQDVPAQAHVAPPAPVSTDVALPHTNLTKITACKGDRRIYRRNSAGCSRSRSSLLR